MDTIYSPYKDAPPEHEVFNRKVIIVAAAAILLVLGIVASIFLFRTTTSQPQNTPDIPVIIPSVTVAPLQNDPVILNEVRSSTESFVSSMNAGDIRAAVLANIDAATPTEQKEQLVQFLEKERQTFSRDGSYDPAIAPNGIQVAGERAQVLLEETLNGQLVTIRRDLIKTPEGWKIEDTVYNKPLDLKEQQEALILEETLTEKAEYRHTPQTYPLPNGDKLEIFRTYWSESGNPYTNPEQYAATAFNEIGDFDFLQYRDFLYYIPDAQLDYTLLLFDAPYIRTVTYLRSDEPSGNYGKYSSFDIRTIEGDIKKAVLLVYEGTVTVDREKPGAPSGWILSIPIAVEP